MINLTQQDIDHANAEWAVHLVKINERRFNPNHDDKGKFATGDGGDAVVFVSPQEKENLTFEDAKNNLATKEHLAQHAAAQDIIEKVDHGGTVHDAIGDTKEWGSENSLIVTAHTDDKEQTDYMGALLADKAHQKAFLSFIPGSNGKDTIWQFGIAADLNDTRKALDSAGISFRTLQADGPNTQVWLFDQGTELSGTMETLGGIHGHATSVRGSGEFIGADTREEAHGVYRKIIGDYESKHEPYSGHYRSVHWKIGDHYRSQEAVSNLTQHDIDRADAEWRVLLAEINKRYSDDQPRDDHGRWTDEGGAGTPAEPAAGDSHKAVADDPSPGAHFSGGKWVVPPIPSDPPFNKDAAPEPPIKTEATPTAALEAFKWPDTLKAAEVAKQGLIAGAYKWQDGKWVAQNPPPADGQLVQGNYHWIDGHWVPKGDTPDAQGQKWIPGFKAQVLGKDSGKNDGVSPSAQESDKHLAGLSDANAVGSPKRLGGGCSGSYTKIFTDGSKVVWKPEDEARRAVRSREISDGLYAEREASTWEVAKLVGMDDLVAPAAVKDFNGEHGSIEEWQPGTKADDADEPYDGDRDAIRTAAFDYITGNEDRHMSNWLVNDEGKLRLIDHGLTFPDKAKYNHNGWDLNEVMLDHANSIHGSELKSPHDMAAPYVKNIEAIAAKLKEMGLPKGSINGVRIRIADMDKASSWGDLP